MLKDNIEAIILDLGGVILNIDYNKTRDAFVDLGLSDFDSLYSQAKQSSLFDDFETGKLSADDFRNEINVLSGLSLSAEEIDSAWNAMLLNMPVERIELIESLAANREVYLLSNTNEIHVESFEKQMKDQGVLDRFKATFNNYYYSSRIGLRKPNKDVFQFVCNENKLIPANTLFVDDSIQHVHGATDAGLNAVHLDLSKGDLLQLFS